MHLPAKLVKQENGSYIDQEELDRDDGRKLAWFSEFYMISMGVEDLTSWSAVSLKLPSKARQKFDFSGDIDRSISMLTGVGYFHKSTISPILEGGETGRRFEKLRFEIRPAQFDTDQSSQGKLVYFSAADLEGEESADPHLMLNLWIREESFIQLQAIASDANRETIRLTIRTELFESEVDHGLREWYHPQTLCAEQSTEAYLLQFSTSTRLLKDESFTDEDMENFDAENAEFQELKRLGLVQKSSDELAVENAENIGIIAAKLSEIKSSMNSFISTLYIAAGIFVLFKIGERLFP